MRLVICIVEVSFTADYGPRQSSLIRTTNRTSRIFRPQLSLGKADRLW